MPPRATGHSPHPLNTDFTWVPHEPDALRRVTPEQAAHFNDQGYVLLEKVFSPAEVAAVIEAIDPFEARGEARVRAAGGQISIAFADEITFTVHISTRSGVLRAFAAHPAIKDICHDLIGDDVRFYWDQSVYKKTGRQQEFPWHQDNGYTFIEPQQYLTLWIPLVDVDEENGCPWIAPGMHRLGTLKHWTTDIGLKCLESVEGAVPVPAKAGDAVVFSSLTPHRTGPNLKVGSVRKAYILQYCLENSIATLADGTRVKQEDPARQFRLLEGGR